MAKFIFVVVESLSHVGLFAIPWTVACPVPLSMRFPRQEYCSGLPFPSSGELPDLGIEPMSPALAGEFFTTETPGRTKVYILLDNLSYVFLKFFRILKKVF